MRVGPFKDLAPYSAQDGHGDYIRTFLDEFDSVEGRRFFAINKEGGEIIEICGPAGSGKTLFCFQLCVNISLPKELDGPQAESIYIVTDDKFYESRLIDVYHGSVKALSNSEWPFPSIYKYNARSAEELEDVVGYLQFIWKIKFKNVRLLVIDSFSAVFRDFMGDQFGRVVQRQNKVMAALVDLAKSLGILIVITSQVSKKMLASECYTHRVDRRLILRRTRGQQGIAMVQKMNAYHKTTAKYSITKEGIRDPP